MSDEVILTVLLAEDDPATAVLAKLNLEKLGLGVEVASDGAMALQMWRKKRYTAMLFDFNMPRMSGLDAARAVREEEKTGGSGRARIILLTAKPLDHLQTLQTRGVVDFMIPKPVDYPDLYKKLEDLFPGRASAAPAAAMNARKASTPLDLDELTASVGADGLSDIIDIFITQAEKYLVEIEESLALGDGVRISKIAHKIKGSSAQFTAFAMVAPSEILQTKCMDGSVDLVPEKLEILKQELAKVKQYAKENTGL